jgi:hypothetical protein
MQDVLTEALLTLIFNRRASTRDLNDVMKSLKPLETALGAAARDGSLEQVVADHGKTLLDVRNEVELLLQEPNVRSNNGGIIGFRDSVFEGLVPNIRPIQLQRRITRTFNEFVKGITYFAHQEVYAANQPVYHRHGACSPRGTDNHGCLPSNTVNARKVKKADIETCYIERQIFDAIWTHTQSSQDYRHLEWLRKTRKAYESCHPDTMLTTSVCFDERNMPMSVTVEKDNGSDTVTEEYIKLVSPEGAYLDTVMCVRTRTNGVAQRKVSSFAAPTEWRP